MSVGATEDAPGIDECLRRQGWEAGNIDYMGAAAFNNIWAKISRTLSNPPSVPPIEESNLEDVSSPTSEEKPALVSPVVEKLAQKTSQLTLKSSPAKTEAKSSPSAEAKTAEPSAPETKGLYNFTP